MKTKIARSKKNRENEKGAAMIMVLLVSFLLLVASAGLLLETSMNTANVTDATAEQQAYNSAESGIQSALNVLRGNETPISLIDPSKPASDPVNRVNFTKAVRVNLSNTTGDTSAVARLSRWMTYNYAPNGLDGNARVTMGTYPSGYDPRTGYAYNLSITDPNRTGESISYQTEGRFFDKSNYTWKSSIAAGSSVISYVPKSGNTSLDVRAGSASANFGSFVVLSSGTTTLASDIRFSIVVNMTAPYTTTKEMRGWIKAGTVAPGGNVNFVFDSKVFDIMGSSVTLPATTLPVAVNNFSGTAINANMSQVEPIRIVIRSTGFGPRGARKELEATVQKNFFNGLSAPATLTLIGDTSGFLFEAGTSQNVAYSGSNIVNADETIPPIGTTNIANLMAVDSNLENRGRKADLTGTPSDVQAEVPFWLLSPKNLDSTIRELRRAADASGRLFANGADPGNGNFGDNATATGITFIDGDAKLSGNGGGILVCTGKLTLNGAFDFNGLIIVTGAGGIDRRGGGNGLLQGNTVVAPYNPANLNAGFLGPKYDISGGGNSTIRYNSNSVKNGMAAVSNIVLGVAEK